MGLCCLFLQELGLFLTVFTLTDVEFRYRGFTIMEMVRSLTVPMAEVKKNGHFFPDLSTIDPDNRLLSLKILLLSFQPHDQEFS